MSMKCSRNSEAFLENFVDMFLWYYMHSDGARLNRCYVTVAFINDDGKTRAKKKQFNVIVEKAPQFPLTISHSPLLSLGAALPLTVFSFDEKTIIKSIHRNNRVCPWQILLLRWIELMFGQHTSYVNEDNYNIESLTPITFHDDFLEVLKRTLQDFRKIVMKYLSGDNKPA